MKDHLCDDFISGVQYIMATLFAITAGGLFAFGWVMVKEKNSRNLIFLGATASLVISLFAP